ncbi:MAG: NADH-quinone oxidoreductase subunit NuoN [Betaproteobacteria bacterium]
MLPPSLNLALATPEIFLLVMTCVVMVVDLYSPVEKREGRLFFLSIVTLALVALSVYSIASPLAAPRLAFNGMFVIDGMAMLLKLAIAIAVAVVIIYSRAYLSARKLFTGEFITLVLFATLGMMIMVSANHFISLYLGLELLALSSYAMVALNRDSAVSSEAAMKYFILGALASGLLLYGMSMIYGATGSLNVSKIALIISSSRGIDPLILFGMVFVVSGLAFKLGVAPFHMWVPDVYQGAPTAMTLFIGSAPKLAAFGFVMRILADSLAGAVGDWQGMLVILAMLSMALGNIVAISQTNLKRMLAYSTISHMGFLLLGILAGTKNGYASAMFYVITYVLMTAGSFGMIMLLSRAGFEADNIEDFKGLNQRSPLYALMMLFIIFSMAGIPPFLGFWAKLAVLEGALNAGYTWLVVFAVLMSVIGAFYYLRIIRVMYFDAPTDTTPIAARFDMRGVLAINAFALLVLGIFPSSLMTACLNAIQASF